MKEIVHRPEYMFSFNLQSILFQVICYIMGPVNKYIRITSFIIGSFRPVIFEVKTYILVEEVVIVFIDHWLSVLSRNSECSIRSNCTFIIIVDRCLLNDKITLTKAHSYAVNHI